MAESEKSSKKLRHLDTLLVFVAAMLVAVLLELMPWFSQLENTTFDWVFSIRQSLKPDPKLAVIAIDESSLQVIGPAPWPRMAHALLIQKLQEAGARMVVFDVLFDAAREPENDQAMAQAIASFTKAGGTVILGRDVSDTADPQFSIQQVIEPLPLFMEAGAKSAFVTTPRDNDYKIRRAYWMVKGDTTLATEAYFQFTGEKARQEGDKVFLGSLRVPAEPPVEQPTYLINFTGPTGTIPKRSFYQALEGTLPPGFLKDRIVFVGADLAADNRSGRMVTDRFPTPVDTEGVLMPGVEIHANVLNTLISKSFIKTGSTGLIWGMLLLFAGLTTAYCLTLKPVPAGVATIVTIMVAAGTVYYLFANQNIWLPSVRPTVLIVLIYTGNTILQFRSALKERAQISKAFKHYVSAEVLGELMKNPESLGLGGREVEATVLFTDIAGFSKISEKITPQELTQMLNQYFELLAGVVMNENGMVNKFIGDAIMALWGVPLDNPEHAVQACRAALEMNRAVLALDPIKVRIGLNTGKMIAGNLGSKERFEYTVIGDAVNLASRLEGVNKPYHTDIMISEMTEEKVRGHFLLREVDSIRVVGKLKPVRIYQLLDRIDNTEAVEFQRWSEMIASYHPALEAYKAREWQTAHDAFANHQIFFPEDPVGKIYLDRSKGFLVNPPPDDWDGVYQMETK
jgi:adenylate cyclase